MLRVNVVAPLALTQLALPQLEANSGAVVNITSDAAVEAYEGWGVYGASKAALEQLSHVLAVESPAVRVWWRQSRGHADRDAPGRIPREDSRTGRDPRKSPRPCWGSWRRGRRAGASGRAISWRGRRDEREPALLRAPRESRGHRTARGAGAHPATPFG